MKKIDVVLGLQWGDEGKGKVVDVLRLLLVFRADPMLVTRCISGIRVLFCVPYLRVSSVRAQ